MLEGVVGQPRAGAQVVGGAHPGRVPAPERAADPADPPHSPYALPRLVVAAPASGHGKTTVAIGLMAALRRRGLAVAPAKVGPDYIDPGYHLLATGRPGRNLDPFLVGEELIGPLLLRGALTPSACEVSIIEGVMGLFDGRLGTDSFASTAHVARLTASPVLLCIDIRHQSATVGAVVHGLATYDDRIRIGGVVLNQVGSARHEAEARRAIERTGVPVVGALPRTAAVEAPSRHLGLVPAAERPESRQALDALADLIADRVDLDAVLALARQAPPIDAAPWSPAAALQSGPASGRATVEAGPGSPPSAATCADEAAPEGGTDEPGAAGRRPVVAVAGGRAFTFRYVETEELLRAAGCDVVVFDPMTETDLPAGTAGLYLGGGFPEVHAAELAANAPLREAIRAAIAGGLPTVAECAGLLYLCRAVDDAPMVGALPLVAAMTPRLAMGYREATVPADTLLARTGETVRGHEFHRTRTAPAGADPPAGQLDPSAPPRTGGAAGANGSVRAAESAGAVGPAAWCLAGAPDGMSLDPAGLGRPTVHAGYLHVHWAGHPEAARRFADAVHAYAGRAEPAASFRDGRPEPRRDSHAQARDAGVEQARDAGVEQARDAGVEQARDAGREKTLGVRAEADSPQEPDLTHHGDRDIAPGLVDFAVNVRPARTPEILVAAVTRDADWSAYPDAAPLRAALARHHGVPVDHVLPTAGAAEAFTLLARALHPTYPLVVHPQFTEPEAALRAAGHDVRRQLLTAADGFRLGAAALRAAHPAADLVVIGNPTNPTSVLHPRTELLRLRCPGRTLVVDEAFMDLVPGEPESLIDAGVDPAGLLVLRSLTKTWGIAGLRLGYVVGDPALVAALARQQPPWSVSTPAIAAGLAALSEPAQAWARREAERIAPAREDLAARLARLGLTVVGPAHAPYLLVDTSALGPASVREALAERGFAVRRGETFPGLGPAWIRVAVRDPKTHAGLCAALGELVRTGHPAEPAAPDSHRPGEPDRPVAADR